MNVILETDRDREAETRVIKRIIENRPDLTALRTPRLSFVDFFIAREEHIVGAIEIKTRKQPSSEVRNYGGLMLKERKLLELQNLASLMQIPTFIAFAFGNGEGEIFLADVMKISGLIPESPPPRRNFRGLACDDDLVVYLDWDAHLQRIR